MEQTDSTPIMSRGRLDRGISDPSGILTDVQEAEEEEGESASNKSGTFLNTIEFPFDECCFIHVSSL
jgi:hypothetical protein